MIAKLTPAEIRDFWPVAKKALTVLYQNTNRDVSVLNDLLDALLVDRIQLWMMVEQQQPIGFLITQISLDEFTLEKSLLIRELYTLNGAAEEVWIDGERAITNYAKESGCSSVIGYTQNNEKMAKRARLLGYNIEMILFKKEI
jgi:hypothetical protein